MSQGKKTLLMAVASWVLPVLTPVNTAILQGIFCPLRPPAARTVGVVWGYLLVFCVFLPGSLAGALALAVVARRRSARSHASGTYRHATAGLLLSLSLLICYAVAVVFQAVTTWTRT